jgi:uncharacterized UPF0160 family protein
MVLASGGMPWKAHLYDLEKELGIEGQILYIVYMGSPTDWRIQV